MSCSVSLILLAGGKGSRLSSPVPKQFLPLQGKEIARHSFDLFAQIPSIQEMIVVTPSEYQAVFSQACEKKVSFALPGIRRQDSVFQGLCQVSSESNFVCIHDSARPFVSREEVERLIAEGMKAGAAALGCPAKNTVKQTDSQGYVLQTLNRETLWEIHTPQILRKDILIQGFEIARSLNITVTDDVSLAELAGHRVKLVQGSYANFKITTVEDFLMAEKL